MEKRMLLVFTNAVEGQAEAFNDWYDNVHLPDVLKIPGIKSAIRFKLGDVQRMDPPYRYEYCAIYELDTDDVASIVAELKKRPGTEQMKMSTAMVPEREALFFEKISELYR